jgi:glycosyltransferase involved in cell wall biosynthesis
MNITILMPVYEDWDSAMALCQKIDHVFLAHRELHISVLIVDDGTSRGNIPEHAAFVPQAIENIRALILRRNLGHQRAIAVGLAYIQQNLICDALVVMDADGEDRPEDIPALLEAMKNTPRPTAVFAERGKRLENAAFRLFYQAYRALHRIFTGRDIRFGNFSVLPWAHVESLVVFPELWNHYAATFVKSRLPYVRVRMNRDVRLTGRSRMDFVSLVVHGLSALFANQEVVGTRLLVLDLLITAGLFLLIVGVAAIRLLTNLAIPGWATFTMGILFILVSQSLIASFMLVFSIMMNRSQLGFLPIRDYSYFVRRVAQLYPQ